MHPLMRLWRRATRYRRGAVGATALTVANVICDIAPELLIGIAIDVVVREDDSLVATVTGVDDRGTQLMLLGAVTAFVWILESLTQFLSERLWRNLSQGVQHELRMDAYRHVQNLELSWFEGRASGSVLTVLNDDVNQLERFLDVGARWIIATLATVVGVGAVFVAISPTLAVLAFLPIPVIVTASLVYQRRLGPRYAAVREAAGRLGGLIGDNLGGIATIKAFGVEQREADRVAERSEAYAAANRTAITLSASFVPLVRMAVLSGFLVTLVAGGQATLDGELEVGMYSVLVFMTQRLLWPLTDLGQTLDLYQRGVASIRRILDLIDAPVAITMGDRELPPEPSGAVRFHSVDFAYPADGDAQRAPVLRGLDLEVPGGETHAIVGATGAGKSTVVKLLLRLYEPDTGSVTVDGIPIDELRFESLRGAIGYVGQDTFLFDGTVEDNLRCGAPDATDATDTELVAALEAAEAREFVDALPEGLATQVGERGIRISGGQRQRLTIARALIRDPAILVLDEATSAVDNETEAAIQRSLQRASDDRTTIVIAHRLSTIRHADRIHVIHDGTVAEAGTHDELVAAGGRYAALWAVQTGEAALVEQPPAHAG